MVFEAEIGASSYQQWRGKKIDLWTGQNKYKICLWCYGLISWGEEWPGTQKGSAHN